MTLCWGRRSQDPAPGTERYRILAPGMVLTPGTLSIVLRYGFAPEFGAMFGLIAVRALPGRFALRELSEVSPALCWNLRNLLGGESDDRARPPVAAVWLARRLCCA